MRLTAMSRLLSIAAHHRPGTLCQDRTFTVLAAHRENGFVTCVLVCRTVNSVPLQTSGAQLTGGAD
jgi:hypothetical protein